MAERGAHLTGTSHAKPSIFEIVAQDSLYSTLQPALKQIISFLVSCNPARYGWLHQWSDETYLIFNTFLQNYYLKNYSASFSETFYGLKRISLSEPKKRGRLSGKQKNLSLIFLVLGPYFKDKITKFSNEQRLNELDGQLSKKGWQRLLSKYIAKGHTIFHILGEVLALYQYLLYISNLSSYPTPFLWFASLTLTYADPQISLTTADLLRKIKLGTFNFKDGIELFQQTVTCSLEFGAFFLQFLQWWNQEHYYKSLTTVPIPPAPVNQPKSMQGYVQYVTRNVELIRV
ncbi:peroxisome assembly protein 12 isoform X2 [Cephus cinctus]|uniref:Peroxisome assembly protein 12 isoform X2 n=1 Tax=Cephus cinctus TaxID=211228 RepID=A0AAJ7RF95_CEPCN|nr:peroxisome assembly protein 12 isoform X2 [Cephus cinctus]